MSAEDRSIDGLREALTASPDNVPLRGLLARQLLSAGRAAEAESEFREALQRAPADADIKLGLAEAYFAQQKMSHALVIVEDLARYPFAAAAVLLLHARLLLARDDKKFAATQYRAAIEEDPGLADADLAKQLGIASKRRKRKRDDPRVALPATDLPDATEAEIQRPKIKFDDVGGMDSIKEEIRVKIIYPLEHPEIYQQYGKQAGGGILMYGPPGCGKTHLARATAGEIDAGFLAVGINDVLDMWLGSSERNLHDRFDQARDHAPCVLFFDEVDALGASRTDMRKSAGRQLINQFLAELDGVETTNDGVLILAATNAPWHLDAAFRRPGRFDRILFVPPPDASARAVILQLLCREKPIDRIDFSKIATRTADFSGADLRAVVDMAVESKLRDAIRSGAPKPLTTGDFIAAAKSLRPTTKEWFATARNYALYSNQGGMYDDIVKYLNL